MNADGTSVDYFIVNGTAVAERWNYANGSEYFTMRYTFDETGSVIGFSTHYPDFVAGYWEDYLFAKNLQGDVVAMYLITVEPPRLIATYEYDEWGKVKTVRDATGAILTDPAHLANRNPFRYRSYHYDIETGFYYLQSRYYDPAISRFINADSYATTGQGFLGTNMFAYCGNNPVNMVDPSGCIAITAPGTAPVWDAILEALTAVGVYANPVVGIFALCLLSVRTGDRTPIKTAVASASSSLALSEKIDWEPNDNRKHHILNGTDGGHINGWKKMGIDPDDKNAWGLVYPILRYVVDNYDTISQFAVENGAHVVKYTKEFAQLGVTVVVRIWVSADGLIQKLSDAWAAIH